MDSFVNNNIIGIHVSLWTPEWSDDFVPFISKAADLGFDAVEIPLMDPDAVPVGRIKKALAASGLSVYCGTGLGPSTDISSTDAGVRKKGEEHLVRCLELAAEIGSPSLEGVLHSAWGRKGVVRDQERSYSADVLRSIAVKAEKYGMKLGLECLNRYESSFLNTVHQGKVFLRLIDRPNVGLHLDTYHMNIEERSIPQALKQAGEDLFFLHVSENNRGFPGRGSIPWHDIGRSVSDIGYTGPIVIESYITPDCSSGNDVSIWRPIEKDAENTLKNSLLFVKGLFGLHAS